MLGCPRRADEAFQTLHCSPQIAAATPEPPPVLSSLAVAVPNAGWGNVRADILERQLVQGGITNGHPAKVNDPLVSRTSGHIPGVHPGANYIGVWAAVRVGPGEHLSRDSVINVERANLDRALERNRKVLLERA